MVQKQPFFGNTGTANPAPPNGKGTCLSGEAEVLGGNGRAPEPLEAGQFQPMRMWLPGHEFGGAFAHPLGPLAPHETAMVEEELEQGQVIRSQVAAEEKVVAQPAVEVFDQRVGADRLTGDLAACR